MKPWWPIGVPLVGIAVTASLPFVWSWQGQRDERTAIEVMAAVHAAQEQFRSSAGGYASDVETLAGGCRGASAEAMADALEKLRAAGYILTLRPAKDAMVSGRDCTGRDLASDYYLAMTPAGSATYAQRAYAARAVGRVYVFFDRVPPREADIDTGLATPLDTLEEFRIP